jgi:integrase
MTTTKPQGWYWKEHGDEYERESVKDIERFCGWETLQQLVDECGRTNYTVSPIWGGHAAQYRQRLIQRDRGLIATLFSTGGRVTEVLQLRTKNFDIDDKWIRVTGMETLKRFSRDKTTGETTKIHTTRGRFSIPRDEALVPYMLTTIEGAEDFIFPSPKKNRDHISKVRAYQIVRSVGERCDIKIYPHWFRAQRASQLAEELNFNLIALMRYFNWEDMKTAKRYARLSTEFLERMMRPQWMKRS